MDIQEMSDKEIKEFIGSKWLEESGKIPKGAFKKLKKRNPNFTIPNERNP